MIEFNKVSTESYFIKNLLYSTFLPLLRTVRENDYIIKDRLYIYKCNIIKCTNSGYIPVKNTNLDMAQYPESILRKTDDEKIKIGQVYYSISKGIIKEIIGTAGDTRSPISEGWFEQNVASYNIIGEYYFGEKNGKLCSNFLSSSEGYDYKTHEKLGQYLRSLRDMYGLNLLPLYNCFSNQPVRNLHITNTSIEKTSKDYSVKVFKVPIRFNTDYTICMENIGMTTFAPAFIRHGTLLKLNNNRFGNGLDATNKYIKLNHNDVIHNKPNLRFKNPIKIRFDNIPKNKIIHYSKYTYTELPSQYSQEYYRLNPYANPSYIRISDENTYRTIDYNNPYLEGKPNIQPGYKYVLDTQGGDNDIFPNDDLFPDDNLYPPVPAENLYESINPSIGTFNSVNKSFKKCFEDETFFNKNIFNNNKTKYYTYDSTNDKYIQCTNSSVYNENTIYYYVNSEVNEGWYEFIEDEFVPTEDTYIDPEKIYYKRNMTEVPVTFNYDITEENCCMYDYIEDNLYLLIQVPSSYNNNIVILEGDYTNIAQEKIYDLHKFEIFSNSKLDYLFTENLILMETGTNKIRPFSKTLIQFLLWNAINNLDSINNNMDRLANYLTVIGNLSSQFKENYWSSKYRKAIFDYAKSSQQKYIRDNLGYVTKDIEKLVTYRDQYLADEEEIENRYEPTLDFKVEDEE